MRLHNLRLRGITEAFPNEVCVDFDSLGEGLIQWEFPRLCRGGSKSLTVPGVHPGNSLREPRSTRKGESGWTSMKA